MLNFNWHPLLRLYTTIVHTPFAPTYTSQIQHSTQSKQRVFRGGRNHTMQPYYDKYILQSTQQQTSDVSILLTSPLSHLCAPPLSSSPKSSASWIMTTTTNESATLSLHQRISSSLARTSRTRAAEASGRRRRKNEPSVSFSARQHLS